MADSRIFTPSQVSISTTNDTDGSASTARQTIILQSAPSFWRSWFVRGLLAALSFSVLCNIGLFSAYQEYFASAEGPIESYHAGDKTASDKIALLQVNGTIMPPYTERLLKQIQSGTYRSADDGDGTDEAVPW